MSNTSIDVKTRVAFSRAFLQSTAQHSGRVPFLRGEVTGWLTKTATLTILTVRWDDGTVSNVNVANLVREDRLHLEPN